MSKLKDTSIGLGTTPASLPKISNPRPTPPKVDAPRDAGGMSTGTTSGNFSMAGMTMLPNNAGPRGTQDVADGAAESFASPKSSMP